MGTEWEITISAAASVAREERLQAWGESCFELLERLEDSLSEFRSGSEISCLNGAPAGEWVRVSAETLSVLRLAMDWAARSGGAFDPTFRSAGPGLPPVGGRLEIDPQASRVRRLHEGVQVALGAIGKGFAVDAVRDLLERQGVRNFRIVAGGSSLYFSGEAWPGQPWTWSWAWGKQPGERTPEMPVTEARLAVGVSGTSEKGDHIRCTEAAGPGVPLPRSVLVADARENASAAELDAASTALFAHWKSQGAGSEIPGWLDRGWKVAVRSSRMLPFFLGLLGGVLAVPAAFDAAEVRADEVTSVAGAEDSEEVDLSSDLTPSGGPVAGDSPAVLPSTSLYSPASRNAAWILLPLFGLGLAGLHLRRPPRRTVDSQVRPSARRIQEDPS